MLPFKRYIEPFESVEIIAKHFKIRELTRLKEQYGGEKWRKLKGNAFVELLNGQIRYAELHWYECHGIGKRKMKIKRLLD
mgnify:CR=1 FL=1